MYLRDVYISVCICVYAIGFSSYGGCYKVTVCLSVCLCLSVHQFGIFLRNGLIVFPDFWRDGG